MARKKTKTKQTEVHTAAAETAIEGAVTETPAAKATESAATGEEVTAQRTKKGKGAKSAKVAASQAKKWSALDAAAMVLQEANKPMNCQEMIAVMAAKGYWSSPAGQTPASTLYSALLREIKIKGNQARFQKTARGQFAYQAPTAS